MPAARYGSRPRIAGSLKDTPRGLGCRLLVCWDGSKTGRRTGRGIRARDPQRPAKHAAIDVNGGW